MHHPLVLSLALWALFATPQHADDPFRYSIRSKALGDGKTSITVIDRSSARTVFDIVLKDVYVGQYHPYEYHNGNLYVLHRTGGPDGYAKYLQTWTDGLWKYDQHKKATFIYNLRGLDFRVSPDEKHIAIESQDSLFVFDSRGTLVHQFTSSDFETGGIGHLYFTNHALFFSNGGPGASVETIFKVNLSDFTWQSYELAGLRFDYEFDFNPFNEMALGTDKPFLYDSDSYDTWKKDKPTVTLYLVSLRSNKKTVVATSTAKEFHPKWIDMNHIAYDDPVTSKIVIREIK
jgi:hypothetical protein